MPKGLGKGLEALITGAGHAEKTEIKQGVAELDISKIRPNKYQPRKNFDTEKLKELVESIREKGVVQPILVRETAPNEYEIIAGERRFRAAKELGFEKVPVIIRKVKDEDMLELALIENIQRENLNPIEEAGAYKQLIEEFKLTQEELSKRVGKDRSTITNFLRLLNLPQKMQDYVSRETISAGHARVLLGIDHLDLQENICDAIIKKNLSVRQTEEIVGKLKKSKDNTVKFEVPKDVHILDAEKQLQYIFGAKVKIKGSKSGKIEVYFASLDELNRIYDIMNKMG